MLKILRIFKLERSIVHEIIIADLPEYDFNDRRFFDLRDQNVIKLARKKPVLFMYGRFFRDYEDLFDNQDKIRTFFTPIPSILARVTKSIEIAKSGCDALIGVHVRRGDYAVFADGKYFYSTAQYYQLMLQVQIELSHIRLRFLICSNEDIDLNEFKELDVVKASGHVVEDLYCLSHCDYIMGPPSTFTKWASFYGSKPLYQIASVQDPISIKCFTLLPPEELFNF